MGKFAQYAAMAVAIAAAIPTGGTSLLAAGLGVSAAAATAIAVGVQVGASLLAKPPSGGTGGSQVEWKADPRAPIPICVGRTATGGYIIYRKGSGGDTNEYQTLNTVLSGAGPIDAIEATWADKTLVNFAGAAAQAPFKGWLWQQTQRGLCPEPAALYPGAGTQPGWTQQHKLSGLAVASTALRYDNKGKGTFLTEPQMFWVGRWVLCYDPRKDDTYSGGSGPQRADDQSTWVFSKNPYVIGLTFAIGWRQQGIRVAGVGMPSRNIDLGSFVVGANVADFNGWTAGGSFTTADDKWDVLKQILQAGGGEPVREGARLACMISAPRVPIATITRDDIIGAMRAPGCLTRRGRINGVTPVYRSEAHYWEQVPGDIVSDPAFVAADGGERTREVTYGMVQVESGQGANQPTQLAGYDLENAREAGPITMTLKLRWIGYRAGDVVNVDEEETGLKGQQLLITRRSLDPETGAVTLTMRTEDPAKHGRVFARTGNVPPSTDITRPERPGDYQLPPGYGGAYSVILTNDVCQLPADADGNVTSYDRANTTVQVLAGDQDVTRFFGFTVIAPDGNPQGLTVTGSFPNYQLVGGFDASEDRATLTLRLFGSEDFADVSIDKEWVFTKAKAGAKGDDGTSPISLDQSVSTMTFSADYLGNVDAGQFPRTGKFTMRDGTTDVSGATQWTAAGTNCTVSIDGSGLLSVTGASNDGSAIVTGVYAGTTVQRQVTITLNRAPAPPQTPTQQTVQTNSVAPSVNTFTQVASLSITSDDGGYIRGIVGATIRVPIPSTQNQTRTYGSEAKLAFRRAGTNDAFSDFASGTVPIDQAFARGYPEPDQIDADLAINQVQATGTSRELIEVILLMRKTSGTSPNAQLVNGFLTGQTGQ